MATRKTRKDTAVAAVADTAVAAVADTAVAAVADTAVAAVADTAVAAWTLKSGTVKRAYSDTGLAHAPRAVRMNAAQESDLRKLNNNTFTPILREIVANFAGAKLEGLRVSVIRAYEGSEPLESMKPNKAFMLVLSQWANDPVSYKTGVFTRFELTKKQTAIIAPLLAWASMQNVALTDNPAIEPALM